MKKKLKIAIYSGSIPSTTFIEHLIHEVAQHHTVLLFGNIKSKTTYTNSNIKIISTPYQKWQYVPLTIWRIVLLFFKRPSYIKAAYKRAKQYPTNYLKIIRFTRYIAVLLYEPDIFHLQWARRIERWTFLKEVYDCKLQLSLLGTQITVAPKNDRALAQSFQIHFPFVDQFNAVSEHTVNEAVSYGADPSRIKVMRIPISAQAVEKFKLPKKPKHQSIKLVSVGRYDWVKGYRYAIDAIKILADEQIDVQYSIIAPGKVSEELVFQSHQLGISDQITFLMGLDQDELFESMQKFDVLLLPSVTEGIANVVAEAMALGIPVISTNCGGMPEIVIPGETGWLVDVRDAQGISTAVKQIMHSSESEIQLIANNAHKLVSSQFHPSRSMTHFIDAYEELMTRKEVI
ncbi:MAG: glycosyltransferase family 4 protein [Saprospiraceae bacterium]|nr:glycosyltransferase family 4 protein [Saprospiraceae bacterium]